MEHQVPTWLNVDFAEMVMKKSENDQSIRVRKLAIKCSDDDNYGSIINRIIVEYSHGNEKLTEIKKISLIVKTLIMTESMLKDIIIQTEGFEKETEMMTTTLPKMMKILRESKDGSYRLNANVLHTRITDQPYLVIEDLIPLGFRTVDRRFLLNFDHCVLVMRRLAKFHASSLALYEKDPDSMAMYNSGFFNDDTPQSFVNFYTESMKNVANEVLEWKELGSNALIYHEKLLKLSKVCWRRGVECEGTINDEFKVLNHGECFAKNMLFRYDTNGKVNDHIFVDFQLPQWGSPAIDISQFLSTSINENTDRHNRESLISEYLDTLTNTMKQINCKTVPPCMKKLKESLDKHVILEIIMTCIYLPLMIKNENKSMSYNDYVLQKKSTIRIGTVYKGPTCRSIIARRLSEWNARGLIDSLL